VVENSSDPPMQVAVHGLELMDPHPPQDPDGVELAQ
jgi:hypothetical protein